MKILVLNPASKLTKNVVRDVLYGCWCGGKRIGGGTVPPFALLEVATVLKNEGHDVVFLDAQAEQKPLSDVMRVVPGFDAVVISTSTMSFLEDAETLRELKRVHPGLITIIFGSHPTFMPEYSLAQDSVDIIARHEPEFIIRDLFRAMRDGGEVWKRVAGIGFRVDNKIVLNPQPPFIDLEELPFPDVTMLPERIDYYNPLVRRVPYMTTTTSKGCPGRCTFCTAPYFDGMKVRFQSADYVVREIEYFLEHGYREVYFRDDTFFVWKKRDREICQEIISRKLDVTWIANARIGMIDKDMMMLARQAGCHTIKFGVESGVQEILDNVRKGYRVEQAYETFRWAKEAGLYTHAHVMLGMPGDSVETVEETIRVVKELDPTTVTFGICTPYPGTPLFDEVTRKFPQIKDGTVSDLSKLHVQGLFNEHYTGMSREELEASVQRAYRAFYLRPGYVLKMLRQIRGIGDIMRMAIAATNVLDFSLRGD